MAESVSEKTYGHLISTNTLLRSFLSIATLLTVDDRSLLELTGALTSNQIKLIGMHTKADLIRTQDTSKITV